MKMKTFTDTTRSQRWSKIKGCHSERVWDTLLGDKPPPWNKTLKRNYRRQIYGWVDNFQLPVSSFHSFFVCSSVIYLQKQQLWIQIKPDTVLHVSIPLWKHIDKSAHAQAVYCTFEYPVSCFCSLLWRFCLFNLKQPKAAAADSSQIQWLTEYSRFFFSARFR